MVTSDAAAIRMNSIDSVMKSQKICRFLLPLLLLWLLTSCSTMQAISIIQNGEPMQLSHDTVIDAYMTAHFLTVKVKINNSKKEFNFLVDTGTLTVISEDVARELNLSEAVIVESNDTAGNARDVSLVELDRVTVGDVTVTGCGAVIVDLEKLGDGIDGLLGSNFLQYFTVQIDYQKPRLVFLADHYQFSATKTITIPFYKNMKYGFAPTGTCQIDDGMTIDCMIDTGHPEIASIPVSSLHHDLPRLQEKIIVESAGGMTGGILGPDEKSYLTRIDKITVGSLEVQDIPTLSNRFSDEIMTLGYGLLSNYLVTIDYLNSEMYLEPFPDSKLVKTYKSFGLSVDKKDGQVVVKGIWNGSPAEIEGLVVGDLLYKINSQNINDLCLLEIIEIVKSKEKIDLLYMDSRTNKKTKISIVKEDLLPVLSHCVFH